MEGGRLCSVTSVEIRRAGRQAAKVLMLSFMGFYVFRHESTNGPIVDPHPHPHPRICNPLLLQQPPPPSQPLPNHCASCWSSVRTYPPSPPQNRHLSPPVHPPKSPDRHAPSFRTARNPFVSFGMFPFRGDTRASCCTAEVIGCMFRK